MVFPYQYIQVSELLKKELARHNNALAIVKNAVKKPVTIKPNSTVQILGYTDKEIP
jgi:hypothetical protein